MACDVSKTLFRLWQCLLQVKGGLGVISEDSNFTETNFLIFSFSLSLGPGSTSPHPIAGEDDDPWGASPPPGRAPIDYVFGGTTGALWSGEPP